MAEERKFNREEIAQMINQLKGLYLGKDADHFNALLDEVEAGFKYACGVSVEESTTVEAITELDDSVAEEWLKAGVKSITQTWCRNDPWKVADQETKVWTKLYESKSQFTEGRQHQETQTTQNVCDKDAQTSPELTSTETQTGTVFEPTWESLFKRLKECVQASHAQERRENELFAEFWEYWEDDSCPIPEEAHYWADQIGNRESDLQEIRSRRKSRADKKKNEKEIEEAKKKDLEEKRRIKMEKEKELEEEKQRLREAREKIRRLEEEAAYAKRDELFADIAVKNAEAKNAYRQNRERRCPICGYPGVIKGNWCPNRQTHKSLPEYQFKKRC